MCQHSPYPVGMKKPLTLGLLEQRVTVLIRLAKFNAVSWGSAHELFTCLTAVRLPGYVKTIPFNIATPAYVG